VRRENDQRRNEGGEDLSEIFNCLEYQLFTEPDDTRRFIVFHLIYLLICLTWNVAKNRNVRTNSV
jgi:hypothetical protein